MKKKLHPARKGSAETAALPDYHRNRVTNKRLPDQALHDISASSVTIGIFTQFYEELA